MDHVSIQRVLFHHPTDAGALVLALMTDHSLHILHDGKSIGQQYWSGSQAEDAVRAFRQLQEKLARHDHG